MVTKPEEDPARMNWYRWLPTSKITAVGIAGVVYSWGVWILVTYYTVEFNVFEVAATQAWVMFAVGYAITEHRP